MKPTQTLTRLVVLALLPCAVAAQPEYGLDLGAAIPLGKLSTHRTVGPSATVSVGFGNDDRGLGSRIDLSWQRIFGTSPPANQAAGLHEDYSAYSARVALVHTFTDSPRTVYGVYGVGVYRLAIKGSSNPYGNVPGVHLGLGFRVPTRVHELSVEAQLVIPLTDYGAGAFNFPTAYVPLTVGGRF